MSMTAPSLDVKNLEMNYLEFAELVDSLEI